MEDIFIKLKRQFFDGTVLAKLIIINIGVFVILSAFNVGFALFGSSIMGFVQYFELPASFVKALIQPWSLLTYMFLHIDFLHLLFNMLWLFWFGQIFLRRFTERQLLVIYLMGGVAGGLLYMLSYNIFPLFSESVLYSYMLGASASVLAIVVASAMAMPEERVMLMFLGEVKLKYIAIFAVAMSFFNMTSSNAGGNIAHIGGALLGFIFITRLKSGKDITRGVALFIDKMVDLLKTSPRMKASKGGAQKKNSATSRTNQQEIDAILDKVRISGYESLTKEEQQKLFDSNKRR